MTTKHEIEIPDLPEGWRAVAFREPRLGEHYLSDINTVIRSNFNNCGESNLIVEKIKPRRIILEYVGIGKPRIGDYIFHRGEFSECDDPDNFGSNHQIWRIVEE